MKDFQEKGQDISESEVLMRLLKRVDKSEKDMSKRLDVLEEKLEAEVSKDKLIS